MTPVSPQVMTFENRSGRKVFAQIWRPEGTCEHAAIMVHGLGEHLGRYADWAGRFNAVGAAFYALDAHGHGRTTGKRGHTENFEFIYDDIAHLVAKARKDLPSAKIYLYGHSMGGALVLGAFLSRPMDISAVIVTGPALRPGFEPPAWKVSLGKSLDRIFPGLLLNNELDVDQISSDRSIVEAYKKDPLVHDRLSVRWYNEWLRCVERIFAGAKQFNKPVLIVHGASDKLTSPAASEELSKAIGSTATFRLWPKARHELHNEPVKEDVFRYIWQWISKR